VTILKKLVSVTVTVVILDSVVVPVVVSHSPLLKVLQKCFTAKSEEQEWLVITTMLTKMKNRVLKDC